MAEAMRYEFGRNWTEFIENYFSEEKVESARQHLLTFLKLDDLKGKVFLDIGCGSGLHSLAAFYSGADKIISFDYDIHSVNTTKKLREYSGNPQNWEVFQGSVLDDDFMNNMEKADIVYSWGVLHHTGAMWKAVENASKPLMENGVFYIALYTTDVHIFPTPEYWLKIKQQYNHAGALQRRIMEWGYLMLQVLWNLKSIKGLISRIKQYGNRSRGMSYWTDVRDWLGGWPMEFAGIKETKTFCFNQLGLELLHIKAGEANTEYLFRKQGASNYWDALIQNRCMEVLQGPFIHGKGHAYEVALPGYQQQADNKKAPRRSKLMLFEDDIPMGFAHVPCSHIEQHGNSRYSHFEDKLIFSTTDNSDPNRNHRTYSFFIDE